MALLVSLVQLQTRSGLAINKVALYLLQTAASEKLDCWGSQNVRKEAPHTTFIVILAAPMNTTLCQTPLLIHPHPSRYTTSVLHLHIPTVSCYTFTLSYV